MNRMKKFGLFLSCFCFLLMTGCKEKEDLFHIYGQDLSYGQAVTFGYIYTMDYNLTKQDDFDGVYEDGVLYGDYYMQQIRRDIVDTMLLYNEARAKEIKLSTEEKRRYEEDASKLEAFYGMDFLTEKGVSAEDVEKVYEMKALSRKYLDDLTENVKTEEESYQKVHQVMFSTAKLDDEGNYIMNEEGTVAMLSEDEAKLVKVAAEDFSTRAGEGESFDILLKEQDSHVTSSKRYLKYDDLPENYQKAMDKLSVGEVSDPIEFSYGYYVIQLLEKNSSSYGAALSDHDKATMQNEKEEAEKERLRKSHIGNSTDYVEKEWEEFEIMDFIK